MFYVAIHVQEIADTFNEMTELIWKVYFANLHESEKLMELASTATPLDQVDKIFNVIHGIPIEKEFRFDLEETISAFNLRYIQPEVALDHYRDFVRDKIMKEYNKNPEKYHSLYFSVVQSSGYGKSRLLLEAGKRKLHTVYACLRQENSSTRRLPGQSNRLPIGSARKVPGSHPKRPEPGRLWQSFAAIG